MKNMDGKLSAAQRLLLRRVCKAHPYYYAVHGSGAPSTAKSLERHGLITVERTSTGTMAKATDDGLAVL